MAFWKSGSVARSEVERHESCTTGKSGSDERDVPEILSPAIPLCFSSETDESDAARCRLTRRRLLLRGDINQQEHQPLVRTCFHPPGPNRQLAEGFFTSIAPPPLPPQPLGHQNGECREMLDAFFHTCCQPRSIAGVCFVEFFFSHALSRLDSRRQEPWQLPDAHLIRRRMTEATDF